ncbi:TPA: hypothetical protein N1684_003851, partial [Salmonella enterica subsp. enterica serovar Infantis]|nr:hypothetical protein [Salmonella enterica subsp. enterica serovar Infantis]
YSGNCLCSEIKLLPGPLLSAATGKGKKVTRTPLRRGARTIWTVSN